MRYVAVILIALSGAFVIPASYAVDAVLPTSVAQTVLFDHSLLFATQTPAAGKPTIPREAAIALATAHIPGARETTRISAQYVRLTLRAGDGQIMNGVQARAVWLVNFTGVLYDPLTAVETVSLCPCELNYFRRPNTAIVIDAQSGEFLVAYGVPHSPGDQAY